MFILNKYPVFGAILWRCGIPIVNIEAGIEQGRLNPGDTMAIIAAGIGYVWAGAIVQWGAPK